MNSTLRFLCFTWNADGLRICETNNQEESDNARTGFRRAYTSACVVPNFFTELSTKIRNEDPHVVVMSTQDEDISRSYFHSDFLPKMMTPMGYKLLTKEKLGNVGSMASGLSYETPVTGNPDGSALRVSVYALEMVHKDLKIHGGFWDNLFGSDANNAVCQVDNRVSGALAIRLSHRRYGKILLAAVHIPSGVRNIIQNQSYNNERVVQNSANSLCLQKILEKFHFGKGVNMADHVILMGDLNFDIVIDDKTPQQTVEGLVRNASNAIRQYQAYDEIRFAKAVGGPLAGFQEGVNNGGPNFLPTWRLSKFRDDTCDSNQISYSCFENPRQGLGMIGWHDRILYRDELNRSNSMLTCTAYERIDIGNIRESSHAGVLAIINLKGR